MKKKNYLAPAIEVIPVNKVSLCITSPAYIKMEEYEDEYEDDLTTARSRKYWWER